VPHRLGLAPGQDALRTGRRSQPIGLGRRRAPDALGVLGRPGLQVDGQLEVVDCATEVVDSDRAAFDGERGHGIVGAFASEDAEQRSCHDERP